MALPSLSFLAGLAALFYLSTFILFALLRIVTGISIQRVGYSGFRRIAYIPRKGLRIDIRGLGLSPHRPTFAQPTFVSVILTELKVTVDLKTFGKNPQKQASWAPWANGSVKHNAGRNNNTASAAPGQDEQPDAIEEEAIEEDPQRSRTWERLTEIKEKIKRLHRRIQWIRLVDVVATNSSLVILDVGTVQVVSFTMAVDTRSKTVDRRRLFHHKRTKSSSQRPAEWNFAVRSILFSPEGKESSELLDHCTLNVHGLLYKELDGLRDASIALKLGRLSVPYDDIETVLERARHCRRVYGRHKPGNSEPEISFTDVMRELEKPGSREESIVQTVSDSKEFISSILRGIQEVQFAVSFIGLTTRLRSLQPSGSPVYLNMSMKEVGLDLTRLDPRSPAHLMYFLPNDIAHQALLAAIAISVGIDDGHEHPERLLYIPMATGTVRTTLPAKTIQLSREGDVAERNANILFANLMVTSPSVDLDPRHLPLVLALLHNRRRQTSTSTPPRSKPHHLISRLLPKASIKVSVQEPVVRVSLTPIDPARRDTGEFDLLISAMSSVSLDVESSHSAGGELHYSLASNFRMANSHLYYQTASRERHNLLMTDSLEVKLQVTASPDVLVVATGNAQTFSVYMIRPEISEGVRQIVAQFRTDMLAKLPTSSKDMRQNFLRRLPPWLLHVQLQGSDFNIEIAGVDSEVSRNSRGIALQLESWTAEYKANRNDESEIRYTRRRATSKTFQRGDTFLKTISSPSSSRKRTSVSDGRRLAIHTHGLEAFVVESADVWEPESFLSLPRFEIAFTTSSDQQGPIFHVNSYARSLYAHYSLYRHFALGVATTVLRETFSRAHRDSDERVAKTQSQWSVPRLEAGDIDHTSTTKPEILTIDVKAGFVQLKATMPADPLMMAHVYGLETGRHRWATPFARARLMRLYVETPYVKRTWSRMMSLKTPRLDLRESRRKQGAVSTAEKSIDVTMEATRLAVPHGLVLHKIFDNITNTIKTVEQLHHRFKTGTNEYILDKQPEGPRHVPRITIRSQTFLFDIEDSTFEWKLGTIYRTGLLEQKQRLVREDAFKLKVKRLEEEAHGGDSRSRAKSAHHHRGRSADRSAEEVKGRSKSSVSADRGRHPSRPSTRDSRLRYDTEGTCGLSGTARRTTQQAWEKLQQLNARSWKRRVDQSMKSQDPTVRNIRSMFRGLDEVPDEVEQKETIMAIPQRAALTSLMISDLNILIEKPSFPLHECPKFLHRVGKGMPYDMKYSLLIPMHVKLSMGEVRLSLRDYPLPLLHIPPLRPGQSPRLPSLSMETDFVIAEEFQDLESIRHVQVIVVPHEKDASGREAGGFSVDVRRAVSAVKTYSDMSVDINTGFPTRITWGTSYQPVIQDMMQVIESFTKPPVDPSERVGFWDKIRLTFHSKIRVAWKGDGDVHLVLKGSRDPYLIEGVGAGFVMCWRNDVRWDICQDQDPKKFMAVESGTYVLAVPDLANYARHTMQAAAQDGGSMSSSSSYKQTATFKKTVMKLSGRVRWLAGLVFERNVDNGRSLHFKSHYEVVLKNPEFIKNDGKENYDAFRGFRSNHIHMSVAVTAPPDREWSVTNLKPSTNYNSVHLTPRFFSHFFSWWSMFSGVMSLPIRQGKLWPGIEKSNKKFGRHLATIKYSLLVSPLYMSHIYKHKDAEDYGQRSVSATGLKIRLDSFMLDLHQRREEFRTQVRGSTRQSKTSGMRINQAQLDFIAADIRAVSASIAGTNLEDLDQATDETIAGYQQGASSVDLSRFTIPDNDLGWIDMDDFVELDWMLPAESNPETKILPLAYAPRFTYFRQTDHHDTISGDSTRSSPFGYESTHECVMSVKNDPRRVQCDLIEERLRKVDEQLFQNQRAADDQALKALKEPAESSSAKRRLEILQKHNKVLQNRKGFLQVMLKNLTGRLERGDRRAMPEPDTRGGVYDEARGDNDATDPNVKGVDSGPLSDYLSEFNNRFIVHNAQVKWTNSLRNIILRYIHQVSQRRGFVYYMSRRAVKFILDIVEEQKKSKERSSNTKEEGLTKSPSLLSSEGDDELSVQERIRQLLEDGNKFVNANDPMTPDESKKPSLGDVDHNISSKFTPQNTYHFRLIAPQIQLQSEKNPKAAVLVTAKGMQLKVIQIMDKDRVADDISGLVQRRFSAAMDSLQIFVTHSKTFATEYIHTFSASRYGTPQGSSWPPWVPLEVIFEFSGDLYGFQRVVQRTSATLRYDKYNTLRLKYNDHVRSGGSNRTRSSENAEDRIDHLWFELPQVRAICDSMQYYAMFIIVLDLLLYSEPLEKTRSERLERIMLASDFSDLTGAPEMVIMLQERIRQLNELKQYFQLNEMYLDRQGWKDRVALEAEIAGCEDELFFMMKAITTSQQRVDERPQTTQSTAVLRWYIAASEIAWHLVRGKDESLVELQLKNALYDRTDHNDGSNHNTMEIERIRGLNLLPNALYPEMVGPFTDHSKSFSEGRDGKMLRVHWYMLEAIAGIPVVDHFEVNLHPLKVQLEREVGKKLFEYVFPGANSNDPEKGGFSPFIIRQALPSQQEEDENDVEDIENQANEVQDSSNRGGHELSTGAGSLELRLKPTLHLTDTKRHGSASRHKGGHSHNPHHFRLFNNSNASGSELKRSKRGGSSDNLGGSRQPSNRSASGTSGVNAQADGDKNKRFALHRTNSKDQSNGKETRSDDVTQMVNRASSYMTLAYVKIPSVVLCLSYKGKGNRNIEDVHDLVFRMPTLEYRNKTWSNLDLALQLKKDVIRALISHAGTIVGNKLSHHRPNKQQQSRLREIANSSTLLSTSTDVSNVTSESNSTRELSPFGGSSPSEPRHSFVSERGSELSLSSSMHSTNGVSSSAGGSSGTVNNGHTETSRHLPNDPAARAETEQHNHDTPRGSSITRLLPGIGHKSRAHDAGSDDTEDSTYRKSKLLLGKKSLKSLLRS